MDVQYRIIKFKERGDAVEIIDDFKEEYPRYNLENIKLVISNIKKNRSDYVCEETYLEHLEKYENALKFLTAGGE